ncbi:c-type cytochrome [Haloferula rosea]|uniref:Cytochrome c domain-containing protein n=1 Tax=Haloferula rosea TaxID=490093 RepID=A0A934RHP9_9BACT|nr:hypothetical protein [Haloferula rosea]MBK1828726.1 hypothetical protein [Haloferula rosea]
MKRPVSLMLALLSASSLRADKEQDHPTDESPKLPAKEVKEPEAFFNCKACHLPNDVQVGPSLVEIRTAYPAEKLDEFVEWCINPGKKRPEMPQMPSMAHIPKPELAEIHAHILKVTKGLKPPRKRPREDPFKATKRPRIVRTFVPDASPAAIVVCLDTEEKHNLVWDTVGCRVAYVTLGEIDNWPYLRSNGNSLAKVGKTIFTNDSPTKVERVYRGYRIDGNGLPVFLYSDGDQEFRDAIILSSDRLQVGTQSIPLK